MMSKPWIVGREASADIPIADPSVSREHAEVSIDAEGRLVVTDKGSSNGTFLVQTNGAATRLRQQTAIAPADQVRFGAVTIGAADLITAIRRKQKSVRLIRCGCGAVKPAAAPCPTCGLN